MVKGDTIPIDLVMEILSRLPSRSIARCRCVSKLWGSMLLAPYFTELYLTKSSPGLLFVVKRFNDWCFLTSPHPQNVDEKPLSLTADFQMRFSRTDNLLYFRGHASGFIYFFRIVNNTSIVPVICNPSTGQYVCLTTFKPWRFGFRNCLGFDPIDKQFKVLSFTNPLDEEPAQILTLGTGNDSWRKIHCPLKHSPHGFKQGICINGVVYYLATQMSPLPSLIVCFDVRSEKFKFIHRDYEMHCTKLVNYKGELGLISFDHCPSSRSRFPGRHPRSLKLRMWVIKDVNNLESEWLECFSFCWDDEFVDKGIFSVVGVTATREIVLSTTFDDSGPFYVIYINTERNTIQKVEIQGLRANDVNNHHAGKVEVFADYVENLNFITMMKTTKCNSVTTSTTPPQVKHNPVTMSTSSKASHMQQNGRAMFESVNKFNSLRLLDNDECT